MSLLSRCTPILLALALCLPVFAQSSPATYDEATHLYHNRTYAFSCKIPAGWVLRTEQMNPESTENNQVLVAAFERPPEATGPAPASTILIATEPQSTYPGLKTAEDYVAPLTEVVTAKGFKAVDDPYPFQLGVARLIRADFSREGKGHSTEDRSTKDRPTMYQSTLVLLSHNTILSFTFLASSEDEVDQLIENLTFSSMPQTTPKSAPKPKTR